jgi:hypothetical protein
VSNLGGGQKVLEDLLGGEPLCAFQVLDLQGVEGKVVFRIGALRAGIANIVETAELGRARHLGW